MNIENLKKLIEQAQGKSANEFWLATGKRPTDVIVDLAKALEEKDQKIEAMKVEAEGSNQRTQMIFEAKNLWVQRARTAEQRLLQPIKLSQRYETAGYCIAEHYCQEADDGDYLDRDELIASLREQGFKVEGGAE